MKPTLIQTPAPGEHRLYFRGDRLHITLNVQPAQRGRALVRTNIGHAAVTRREIIRQVENNETPLGHDWFDLPMRHVAPDRFELTIGLGEVGHFDAKCLFIPEGRNQPIWPPGPNTAINVEPADSVCGNIIYNAFVRQFGPYKHHAHADPGFETGTIKTLDSAGFTVIPPSGTFRNLIAELDFIMHRLGCRVLQLLPIHPTPTTYARMGFFGSPYAALSFTAVDPALAVFDPKATPLDQFLELVDAVHARDGRIIIDIAINHTGWAASLHETHPQWLARNAAGQIENPGAWGVVWEDLTRLDFEHQDMWTYMAEVFLTWCRRGVDGFRCDAGYMVPVPAWRYIIAKVRDQFPDTIFLLEGLGGKIEVTRDLLNRANFNWAYSELFQNYDRGQIEWYLPGANDIAATDGMVVHFAETHDNNRLAANSLAYARMRTDLCALLSPFGAFAFTNGVEWFAAQKINVHQPCALNWGALPNQVGEIGRLSAILKTHPVFGHLVNLELIGRGEGNFIALLRHHRESDRRILVLVNLEGRHPVSARWSREKMPLEQGRARDLLSGREIDIGTAGTLHVYELGPHQTLCLTDPTDPWPSGQQADPAGIPPAVIDQRLRAKVMEMLHAFKTGEHIPPETAAIWLRNDPEDFCRRLTPQGAAPRIILWEYPVDLRRQVMVPPGYGLLLRGAHPFQARIRERDRILNVEHSLTDAQGVPFVLFPPLTVTGDRKLRHVDIVSFGPQKIERAEGQLLHLADGRQAKVCLCFDRDDCRTTPLSALGTDGRGAMLRVAAHWQNLSSRYDALLAANLNPEFPEDRRILLTRYRAWVVYQGFSIAVNGDCLERFGVDLQKGAWWHYRIPTGQGQHILLQITMAMATDDANCVRLNVLRLRSEKDSDRLGDDQAVTLIIRPDIEDRNFHHSTKAYTGPEHHWPAAVRAHSEGFDFFPSGGHGLRLYALRGRFYRAPEWYYMVHRSAEAERGHDPDSDLFSPGYFSIALRGGQDAMLTAWATTSPQGPVPAAPAKTERLWTPTHEELPLEEALRAALDRYAVRRGAFRTVIAGYPWFLDWGRDTLIAARGLVAAGKYSTVRAILNQFASFEDRGTIPNMIRGQDASNRDTSDAPLWLFIACADLTAAEGRDDFLESDCAGRSLRRILIDIANALIRGTPNGIVADPASGLVYSPSHFTWMDTNHPAGSPRQGYAIEIQALWYSALKYLETIDDAGRDNWHGLAEKVAGNIKRLFWRPELGYLVDCRHALPGQGAQAAQPDDALRPNQLLALTLGAISDRTIMEAVLRACGSLLVPGAIRSLADRPVTVPLEIRRDGQRLNDPLRPYWGSYRGDEDTRRKPAYHNGTAWTWLFPSYAEAWVRCYGPAESATALAWLSSSLALINAHCVGHVPEIVDGDAPHRQRGCDAQAWGVSELLRVWKLLQTSPLP